MPSKIASDPRIDPRIKMMFGAMDFPPLGDIADREALLAEANSLEAKARDAFLKGFFDSLDTEANAPSAGLAISEESVVSAPDGNRINIRRRYGVQFVL
jgi:hypothetical protein